MSENEKSAHSLTFFVLFCTHDILESHYGMMWMSAASMSSYLWQFFFRFGSFKYLNGAGSRIGFVNAASAKEHLKEHAQNVSPSESSVGLRLRFSRLLKAFSKEEEEKRLNDIQCWWRTSYALPPTVISLVSVMTFLLAFGLTANFLPEWE